MTTYAKRRLEAREAARKYRETIKKMMEEKEEEEEEEEEKEEKEEEKEKEEEEKYYTNSEFLEKKMEEIKNRTKQFETLVTYQLGLNEK